MTTIINDQRIDAPALYEREYRVACMMLDARCDAALFAQLHKRLLQVCDEEASRRRCRLCRCTDAAPCVMHDGEGEFTCAWVENDLCSFCASTMFRDREIKTSRGEARKCTIGAMDTMEVRHA